MWRFNNQRSLDVLVGIERGYEKEIFDKDNLDHHQEIDSLYVKPFPKSEIGLVKVNRPLR